jgi:hypothetical protein
VAHDLRVNGGWVQRSAFGKLDPKNSMIDLINELIIGFEPIVMRVAFSGFS